MPYFKVTVFKHKTFTEVSEGTAYIKATDLEQATKKVRRIDRYIDKDEVKDNLNDIDFDEENSVLINLNDLAETEDEEFTTTTKKLLELSSPIPDDVCFEVCSPQEIQETEGTPNGVILTVPKSD